MKFLEAKQMFGVAVAIVIILLFSIPFLYWRKKKQKINEKEKEEEFFETETIKKEEKIEEIGPNVEPLTHEILEIKEIDIVEEPIIEETFEVPLTKEIKEIEVVPKKDEGLTFENFNVSKAKKKPIPGNLSSYYWVFEISCVDSKTNEKFEVHRRYSDFEWLINVLGIFNEKF
jgi:hypothetical protein